MAGLDEIPPDKLEALRVALATMLREGVDLSVRRLRERAEAKTLHAQGVLAAYRAGRFAVDPPPRPALATRPVAAAASSAPVEDAPPCNSLEGLVEGVDDHEKALAATQQLMARVARGEVDLKLAGFLLDALKEARQSIKGKATEGGDEVEDVRPCTLEGAELVALFEGITSEERRAGILVFARRELEADQATGPSALGQIGAAEGPGT